MGPGEVDLTRVPPGNTSLADVLERETSIRVKRYGGEGAQSSISIRGSNPNQTNLYLDGIPLSNAFTGESNLADYDISGMDRIQIFRSGQTGVLSGSAIGGSVNLLPDQGQGDNGKRLRMRAGSEKTIQASASIWDRFIADESESADAWRARYSLTAHGGRSDQNYKFRNDNGTPIFNELDDFDDRRRNAQYKQAGLTGTASAGTGNTDFKIIDDLNYRMQGVPGPGNRQTEKTKREILRNTTGIGSDTKGLGFDWLRLETRGYYTYYREKFFDPRQELSSGSTNSDGVLKTYGLHTMPTIVLPALYQTFRVFLGEEREEYHQELKNRLDERTNVIPGRFRNHTSIHVQDEIAFLSKRVILLPSFVYEDYRDRFPDERDRAPAELESSGKRRTVFRTGGFHTILTLVRRDQAEIQLRAGGSDERRIPTFLELFGERGSVVGNSRLRPERSKNYEGGLALLIHDSRMPGEISITAFRKDVKDMILFVPNSQFSLRPENVDAARISGVEGTIRFRLREVMAFHVNYTYQLAINESDVSYLKGKYLPLRPVHDLHTGLAFNIKKFELGADGDYVGAVFRDRTNEYTAYQEGRWVYGAFLTFHAKKEKLSELSISLNVKNILNKRLEDVIGYPLPGRTYSVSLNQRF